MLTKTNSKTILQDLGDGLILRQATPEDAEALAAFNARIHSDDGPEQPDERVGAWTRDLLTRPHPTFTPGDFTVVEDTRAGKIVSSLNLINQTWSYGGIPFLVGRPELVGTDPAYRNRGLVRTQFEVIHQWSAGRGQVLQAITGIPFYYRLFGYEMALDLGGGRVGFRPQVPKLKAGEAEPYRVRPAGEADLDYIAHLYNTQTCRRNLVNCLWDESLWRYELEGKSLDNINRAELHIVEAAGGEIQADRRVGFLAHYPDPWGPVMNAVLYEVAPGVSWGEVTPSVVRYLYQYGYSKAEAKGKAAEFGAFGFHHGAEHPVYAVLHDGLPRYNKPYAWYLRVPDLPGFLRRITPFLEQRLAASTYVGHSAELKLTFYSNGLRLVVERGRITQVESWRPEPVGHSGSAAFPGLTFLQLLFGYRSLDELRQAFPDCWYDSDEVYGLLTTLFPKESSHLWPVS